MTNTHEIKELFIKAYFTTKRLRPVSYITKLGVSKMATRIYENVMIFSQQSLATKILKRSFVDNISKRIFVFFLQWSKIGNI